MELLRLKRATTARHFVSGRDNGGWKLSGKLRFCGRNRGKSQCIDGSAFQDAGEHFPAFSAANVHCLCSFSLAWESHSHTFTSCASRKVNTGGLRKP
jgi:hypothetical protein